MTKYLTILSICLLPFIVRAQTTHYIDPTGSDATGNGTSGNPWASLSHACSSVSTAGDTIFVNAGTYTEANECVLAAGVNIKGADSSTTRIKFTYPSNWNNNEPTTAGIVLLSSTQGTIGNQTISNLTIDGNSLTCDNLILIKRRGGVIIHDCTIKDFYSNGICLMGASDPYTKPTSYSIGNQIYNCIITNCSDSDDTQVGGGLINMSGQKNFTIHDCNLSDTSRVEGANGDIIVGNKYGLGFHYYNNHSYKPSTANAGWNFHLEMPSEAGGAKIDSNYFFGGDQVLDLGDNIEDTPYVNHYDTSYAYKYLVSHNYFEDYAPQFAGTHGKYCISVEGYYVRNIFVDSNKFVNIVHPFSISEGSGGVATDQENIRFASNVCINSGQNDGSAFMNLIEINKDYSGSKLKNVYVLNNTIVPNSLVHATILKLTCSSGASMSNIVLGNNIAINATNGAWLNVDNTGTIDSLILRNNDLYNNVNSNNPTFSGNTVTHYINSGNINSDPLFVSPPLDLSLQSGSPAIGAAYPYGYGSDIGALQYSSVAAPTISVSGNQVIITSSTSVYATATWASGHSGTYAWTQTAGTAATFGSPTASSTTLSGLTGHNTFKCTVTQDDSQAANGSVNVNVDYATANAGGNQTVTLPTNNVTLNGSGTSSDGTISSYWWTQISGPNTASFGTPAVATTTVTGLIQGTYVFNILVTDSYGATANSTATITVNPGIPVINPGSRITLYGNWKFKNQ